MEYQQQPFFAGRLSLPPGVNASYKIVRIETHEKTWQQLGGTAALKQFKEAAGWELKNARIDRVVVDEIQKKKRKRIQTPLALTIIFFYATLWLHDEDSGIKATQDAIFKHLKLKDNLVCRLIVDKKTCREDPHVEFAVSLHTIQ